MAKARQCDRCKKYFNETDKDKCIDIYYRNNKHLIRKRDLCNDCYEKLNNFLDKPNEQEATE